MAKRRIKRILTTSERRKKVRRKRLVRLFLLLFLLILIVSGIIYCLRLSYLRIQKVDLQGLDNEKKPDVAIYIQNTLIGNKYLFIPNNEILFYSTKKLTDELISKYSFIQKVTVSKDYPNNLSVNVTERSPDGLYCSATCYFIDSSGLIYAPASSFSSGVYMTFTDNTRDQNANPIQTEFIDSATYNEIKNYENDLRNIGLVPIKINIIASKEIKIDNENNGHILLNLNSPYGETIENIKTVFIEGVKTFEYIDVRYGNKIYYK